MWHDKSEDWATVYQFTAFKPSLNDIAASHINIDYSQFECFQLRFTDGLFSVIFLKSKCYYQDIQGQQNKAGESDH
jgi:hypothetical protein